MLILFKELSRLLELLINHVQCFSLMTKQRQPAFQLQKPSTEQGNLPIK
jgi:hypothetical protein